MTEKRFGWQCERFGTLRIKLKRIEGGYTIEKCKEVGDAPEIPSELDGEPIIAIEENAFLGTDYYCDEKNWSGDVLYLGEYLIKVKDTHIGDVYVREGTRVIADGAFRRVIDLTGVRIPEGVVRLGGGTFAYCRSLGNIFLPSTLKEIEGGALTECRNLLNVSFRGTEEQWERVKIGKVNESLVRAYKYFEVK